MNRLPLALVAFLFVPACGPRKVPVAVESPAVAASASEEFRPSARKFDKPPREPQAIEARNREVRTAAEGIRKQCPQGDWDQWQKATQASRQALKDRVAALPKRPFVFKTDPETVEQNIRYIALEALDDFPLAEISARHHLPYLYDPAEFERVMKDRTIPGASRWFADQGIDLIFVVVPTMAEVYSEHFVRPCPADGVIAPHVRRSLLTLLESDVEVVDGLSLFRSMRQPDPDYLYFATDTHWAPRGMRVMAKEVARRLERYRFASKAKGSSPVVRVEKEAASRDSGVEDGDGWDVLRPAQRVLVAKAPATRSRRVTLLDGREPADDTGSPLLVLGNSYVPGFREELIAETNLLPRCKWSRGQTVEQFGDFLREPESLEGVRVVVWVTTEWHMTHFPALPRPVMAALDR